MVTLRQLAAAALLLAPLPGAAGNGGVDHGRVVLDNFTRRAKIARSSSTTGGTGHATLAGSATWTWASRQAAGQTRVSARTNQAGYHCGGCHDGKALWRGRPIFAACSGDRHGRVAFGLGDCERCHDRPKP